MKFPYDPVFQKQREAFHLRHTCEECALFDPLEERCTHGWPDNEHRDDFYDSPPEVIVFCKEFELK